MATLDAVDAARLLTTLDARTPMPLTGPRYVTPQDIDARWPVAPPSPEQTLLDACLPIPRR